MDKDELETTGMIGKIIADDDVSMEERLVEILDKIEYNDFPIWKKNEIRNLIEDIKKDPYGRRKIISLWQEADLKETEGLAPCAFLTIWNVRGKYLDMMMVQRSGDMLTASGPGGVNEIQYAALLMMIARHTGYEPGVFTHVVANEQIYDRHIDAAKEMLSRWTSVKDNIKRQAQEQGAFAEGIGPTPELILNPNKTNFYDFTIEDFEMLHYDPMKPQLKLELGI